MKKIITIEYDVVWDNISVDCDSFTAFEALGLLEAAKAMVTKKWLDDPKNKEGV